MSPRGTLFLDDDNLDAWLLGATCALLDEFISTLEMVVMAEEAEAEEAAAEAAAAAAAPTEGAV